jgi:hypothetical protein
MRTIRILRSLSDVLPGSNGWGLLLISLLGANTALAVLAWFVVGLFFE